MIKAQVIGNLGKDAEVKNVNGKTLISFSVCHTEKFTSNGEKKEKSLWVNCSYWTDKTAVSPYLKKGTQVYVEGQPDVRIWGDAGNQKASFELRVSQVQLLGSRQEGGNVQQPSVTASPATDFAEESDLLPF